MGLDGSNVGVAEIVTFVEKGSLCFFASAQAKHQASFVAAFAEAAEAFASEECLSTIRNNLYSQFVDQVVECCNGIRGS